VAFLKELGYEVKEFIATDLYYQWAQFQSMKDFVTRSSALSMCIQSGSSPSILELGHV